VKVALKGNPGAKVTKTGQMSKKTYSPILGKPQASGKRSQPDVKGKLRPLKGRKAA
jgi:hypothetical protein